MPKTKVSKVDALKEIIRAWGMNPEQLLAKDALAEGAITRINPTDIENHQLVVLSNQLKELIHMKQDKFAPRRLVPVGPAKYLRMHLSLL